MGEKELFNFGDKELNVTSLINNINSNQQSYLNYYSTSIPDTDLFIEKVNYIKDGIKNGTITTDGTGVYYDSNGKLSKDDLLMNNALHYIDIIAQEQSKQTRSLTRSEVEKKDLDKKRKQLESQEQKVKPVNTKPEFTPPSNWSVAAAFAHSFNLNGKIPYDLLQQLITLDETGNPVYTELYNQLDKNFDQISSQLQQFSNVDSYINNINLFKQALKDGDLSPQDKFLGMELGFLKDELDKLNNLIKYQILLQADTEAETEADKKEEVTTSELLQDPLESDESYRKRVLSTQHKHDWYVNLMNDKVNFLQFEPAKKIKNDSDKEFINYLIKYIRNWILHTSRDNSLTRLHNYISPSTIGALHNSTPVPLYDITTESLKYMDPKLYNELGLKFFSNYSASKMYKYFKDLVDQQNKTTTKNKSGGVLKAENGMQTPWRRNFDGLIHNMDAIYQEFVKNFSTYDSKQIADVFNKLNGDAYKSLNFQEKDNTLGFRDWNVTFNESGLNNLFGYNDNKADYLGVTTRSRNGFVDYLKNLGNITTGNGKLFWNKDNNQWEYSDWVDKNSKGEKEAVAVETAQTEGSEGNAQAPDLANLSLKDINLKKPIDYNPHGIINSLAGYIVNDVANERKHDIQREIPIYLEVMTPEKAFKNAYTYDLEKAKLEILAEANNIQPITSDATAYYTAKNEAIKNARAYTVKLDTEINDRIHQVSEANKDIAFENAKSRTANVNTNAKYRHDWVVEQKQGDVNRIAADNESFQNLNKEIKHNIVSDARKKQKQRDVYANKHILTGITTNPSNYLDGWTKHHDLIWAKGQNGLLETNLEQIEYQLLLAIVNQAASTLFAQYENIDYPGIGTLNTNKALAEGWSPTKHGVSPKGAKGMKIDKLKIGNFIKKLK